MDLKLRLTVVIKDSIWNINEKLTNGDLDTKAKELILNELKKRNLHIDINN